MLEGFFGTLQACLPNDYQGSVPRKLLVECSTIRSGRTPEFLIVVVGHPNNDFRFQKADLDAYISERGLLLEPYGVVLMKNRTSAIDYLEAGLLNILQTTGFGDVMLIFQKGCFVCRVTFSYRQDIKI
ncbi:hypothetical protein ICL16_28970 [Iningainema sp. BLCCT55]|uniref:Uncharacterized protein n=2 Tax=Iningainema TaxID=1932705 RepID=A0A8J7BYL9_9CYAN|nr:hypothetical protein [Iningainema tapete BLCC-T55]